MQHFLQKFLAQVPLELSRLEAALRAGDREAVYHLAHSFRPQLEFVGLHKAAGLVLRLEQAVQGAETFDQLAVRLALLRESLTNLSPVFI